jgi:hypothetical protein
LIPERLEERVNLSILVAALKGGIASPFLRIFFGHVLGLCKLFEGLVVSILILNQDRIDPVILGSRDDLISTGLELTRA